MINLYCIHYYSDNLQEGLFTFLRAEDEEHAAEKFNRLYEGCKLTDVQDCGELWED